LISLRDRQRQLHLLHSCSPPFCRLDGGLGVEWVGRWLNPPWGLRSVTFRQDHALRRPSLPPRLRHVYHRGSVVCSRCAFLIRCNLDVQFYWLVINVVDLANVHCKSPEPAKPPISRPRLSLMWDLLQKCDQ